MKSRVTTGLLSVFILVISSCNPVRVFLEKDQLPNAVAYKTFAIENELPGKSVYGSPDLDKRLQEQLMAGMEKRGFVLDINNPDILLRYNTILSQNQKEINLSSNNSWGYGIYNPYMRRYPYPYDYGREGYKVEKYNLGEVVIDFVDTDKQTAVLRISAVGEVTKPKQLDKNILASADKILTEFSKRIAPL